MTHIMRQVNACSEVPMTHICVMDNGAHFNGVCGCSYIKDNSIECFVARGPLASIPSLPNVHAMHNQAPNLTRSCARLRSFYLHKQIIAEEMLTYI